MVKICDALMLQMNIVTRWPGSTSDLFFSQQTVWSGSECVMGGKQFIYKFS